MAGWSSPQLAQSEGEAEQESATGRRLPPLGQVGLGQRCSVFLWWRAQMEQTGWLYLQTGEVCPYLWQLRQRVVLLAE